LKISQEVVDQLENNILLFFTGKEREASDILMEQDTRSKQDDPNMIGNLDQIKEIGMETRKYLEKGQPDMLGELLHTHWELKRKRSQNMTNPFLDECYELARKNGASGGKLIGAGGGGFFMFYSENNYRSKIIEAMKKCGLRWERFRFDFDGAKILVNT
jgi:D-glycero-alpha-D-manno-heptose-7-phosphate kinase